MHLVTKPRSGFTYLVRGMNDFFSVCKYARPDTGWIEVEHNAANIEKLTKMSREFYEKLPRKYFITLGTPLTYVGIPERDEGNRKTGKMTIPAKTVMQIVWRQKGLTYCNYGGKMVLVGNNNSHQYHVEVQFAGDNQPAADGSGHSEAISEHTNS